MAPIAHESNDPTLRINWGMYDDLSGIIQPHEPLEEYRPGGFHPVTLGDTLCEERYSIRHKLGFGGHSTVWLAWDGQDELRRSH